jgi:3-mercaptopropionate dioxygenase
VHDHTVWGLIGILSGAELEMRFDFVDGVLHPGGVTRLEPGDVGRLLEEDNDVHQVSNAFLDRVSISIHTYGGNIGKVLRHVFDPVTGAPKHFLSGYSSNLKLNIWDDQWDLVDFVGTFAKSDCVHDKLPERS